MKMRKWRGLSLIALLLALVMVVLSGCGENKPAATPAPTQEATGAEEPAASEAPEETAPAEETAEDAAPADAGAGDTAQAGDTWPEDEAIAYCPKFEAVDPAKVTKREGQTKVYVISFEGVELEQYQEYVTKLEADSAIKIVTNYDTRGNAFQLYAHKADESKYEIRIQFTKATKKMEISVTYAI